MAGDEDQRERRFCRLYEANFRPVQAYAVNRLARRDDVADVVAEVFMIAWRRLADVPPPPHDRFWLYGTARRVLSKRYRSASRWHNLLGRNVLELDNLAAVCETIALTVGLGEQAIDLQEGLEDLADLGSGYVDSVGRALAAVARHRSGAAVPEPTRLYASHQDRGVPGGTSRP